VSTLTPTRPSTKRATTTRSVPNATALLTQDHRDVEQLFVTFEGLGPRAHKRRDATVRKIIESLSQHAAIEETVFYPAVRASVAGTNDDILEALEEHHVVKWTLSELSSMSSEDERFVAKCTVLMESVRHHVKEEERDLFPKVRKAMSRAELDELGALLVAAKATAPTRPHPRSPDTPPGNVIANAVVAPLDTASNVIGAVANKVRSAVS
jgi:hemerythrin superfamily protein